MLQAAAIHAKAGIYSANLRKCAVDGLDSRFRGNDRRFEGDPIPNDTNTRVAYRNVRQWRLSEHLERWVDSGLVEAAPQLVFDEGTDALPSALGAGLSDVGGEWLTRFCRARLEKSKLGHIGIFPALVASARRMYTEWFSERCNGPDTLTCLLMFSITVHYFQSLNLLFT